MFLIRYARFCMRIFGEISWLIVDTVFLWPLRLAALKWGEFQEVQTGKHTFVGYLHFGGLVF